MSKNKYHINKNIFRIVFAIMLIMWSVTIYMEGFSIFKPRGKVICPEAVYKGCLVKINGVNITIPQGTTYHYNQHNEVILNILNFGSLILLILAYGINHFLYNKGYFKEIKLKIDE